MKKIILLYFLILFTSCASHYRQKEIPSLESQINSLKYTLVLPENWHSYLDLHSAISYKPIKYPGKYPDTQIHITTFTIAKHKYTPLSKFADDESRSPKTFRNYSRKKRVIQSKFGETYIIDEEFTLNYKNSIARSLFFIYNGDYYRIAFYARPPIFNKYINDLGLILEKMEFKK